MAYCFTTGSGSTYHINDENRTLMNEKIGTVTFVGIDLRIGYKCTITLPEGKTLVTSKVTKIQLVS